MSKTERNAEPHLDFERAWWDAGAFRVAGVDEVGRGAMAGPLVAAAVVLPSIDECRDLRARLSGVRDSKLLRHAARVAWAERIRTLAIGVAVGVVDVEEIDAFGVGPANRLAMERAIWALPTDVDALLLDATTVDHAAPQVGLIDGDARSLSIAAASIVAKVTRDAMMADAGRLIAGYGFDAHKGYATAAHLEAVERLGPCHFHRRCYAPIAAALNRKGQP